ncbi:LolA family protein [Aquisphaera insulae]|uniref:LolA family protein n=1 Tax=Aquisphaera insulae TaxID=2712864 RepID=UPI0013EB2931|nr:hypothetical protein [Aquisphaera insulae]
MQHKRTGFRVAAAISAGLLFGLSTQWTAVRAQAPLPAGPTPAAPPGAAPPAATAAIPGKPAEPASEPPTDAERVIDSAIKRLAGIKSVTATMVQNVDMLKQKFAVKGEYRKAPSSRIYLRLTIDGLADSTGTQLQVCDGETLWEYQQILDAQLYRKRSIKPILERLNSPDMDAKTRDQVMTQLGFAGPETLLLGLRKAVKFSQKEEGTLDGRPVYILRGTWRSRAGLTGPDSRPIPATGPLPPIIPSQAILYLGKDDGWPYKINLVGTVPTLLQRPRFGPDGRPLPKNLTENIEPSKMDLVYSDVKLDASIPASMFAWQAPPNASVEDDTDTILNVLDRTIQAQAMVKRAQAVQQDGPVLNQSLEIPTPPSEPTPR